MTEAVRPGSWRRVSIGIVLLLPEDYSGDKVWDYPDYLVLKASKDGTGRGSLLAKGSFDARWRLPAP